MKRLLAGLLAASAMFAQGNRESYRAPQQAWRSAAPTLEQDAATPSPEFAGRVEAAAQAAQVFLDARAAYFTTVQPESPEQTAWAAKPLTHADGVLAVKPELQRLLGSANDYLNKSINSFATVRDPAIQQIRQAMERERVALGAVTAALDTRKSIVDELIDATDASEAARANVSRTLGQFTANRNQLAEHVRTEAGMWAKYYKDLAEGAATAPRVSSVTPPPNAPAQASPPKPPIVQRTPTAGQVPLARYVGSWTFPARGGLFYGPQPESVELLVGEDNGKLTGTLVAEFALPPGSAENPNLRVDFTGPVQQTRNQVFPAQANDGVAGTIELIPGPAFNLLEVNVQTDPNPGRVRTANFVLLKR